MLAMKQTVIHLDGDSEFYEGVYKDGLSELQNNGHT